MWGDDAASLCVRERGRGGGRKWCSPCSSLSARRSRWLSRVEGTAGPRGALGTPSALHRARSPPSQHSPNTQASAIKTTPNKHTPNTLTTCGGWEWRESGKDTAVQAGVVCLLLVPRPVLPYSPTEVEEPLNYTAEDLLRFKVAYITIHTNCTNAVENFKLVS